MIHGQSPRSLGPARSVRSARALVAAMALLGATGAGHAEPAAPVTRALWVWSSPSPAHARIAARAGFDTLYVQLRPGAAARRQLRTLVRRAERRGVEVWGLGGRKEWAQQPGPLARFVRRAARTPGLAGIVLDVEPHALPAWDDVASGRPRLMRAFLRSLARARRAAGETTLLAAVPFWYDHDGYRTGGRSLLRGVLELTDGVVVMAYRDRADGRDGIVALSRGEVRMAGELRKRAVVSVQTAADELDKLGFAEEGLARMQAELEEVLDGLLGEPGFGGLAVHHYDSFRLLRGP